jgi:hypothetical protein
MVSSTVNSSSSWSKWLPQQSLNLSLGLLEQVRNLPTIRFFSFYRTLLEDSLMDMVSSEVSLNWSYTTPESKSVNHPTTRSFSLSEHTLTPTCRAVSSDVHLNCLRKVVITTESKSVPLGQRGFETSRMTSLFCRNAPWHWLMDGLLKGSSSWSKPSGYPKEFKYVFLLELVCNLLTIFAVYTSSEVHLNLMQQQQKGRHSNIQSDVGSHLRNIWYLIGEDRQGENSRGMLYLL